MTATLLEVQADTPFRLETIDISADPELSAHFGLEIPLLYTNGQRAFRYGLRLPNSDSGSARNRHKPHDRPSRHACVVLVTTGSEAEAETIATALLKEGLVACVNILSPVRSLYLREGTMRTTASGCW